MKNEARGCAECGALLGPEVTDVFCPVCALRGALVGTNGPLKLNKSGGWLKRLTHWKSNRDTQERLLASAEYEGRQSSPVTNVTPNPGEVIGDYEIVERIGGNMGFVFKARHRLLDKIVALKLVPADVLADAERLARFQREIRVMAQLQHPNLVPAFDARSVGAWLLVTMELIDGVDLQQLVRNHGPLPVAAACEATRQAALGLQHAHQHGLIHRDIKPSNLMVTRAGTLKVIDMGLALTRDDATAQLTQTGLLLGTISYCAPEQFRNSSGVDIRADIYSLGCTLYHLLAGRSPYWQRRTMPEIVEAHLHEPFPSLTEIRPDASPQLEALLARMTAKDREQRFTTPGEVAAALEPFVQGSELGALIPPAAQIGSPSADSVRQPPASVRPTATRSLRPSSRFWPRLAAALVLFLVVVSVLFLATCRRPMQSIPPNHAPVVILIDTVAKRGIYDDNNKNTGRSNAKELYEVFQREVKEIPPENIDEESVGLNWDRRNRVCARRPDLVVIHRSVFYHPVAAALNFSYPDELKTDEEFKQFEQRYKILGDDKLREFLSDIGSCEPRTKFLVYSRGTDTNWLSPEFRLKWSQEVEGIYPALKGRVTTMLVEEGRDGTNVIHGTFRLPKNRQELLKRVREILGLPARRE